MPDTDRARYPVIYRAIMKKRWYDAAEQRVLSAAFVLRPVDAGISVVKNVACSALICVAELGTCFGEFVLETEGAIRLGLRVVDDDAEAPDFSENHAEIRGIPVNPDTEEEIRRAERLADDLANLSRLHYDRFDTFQ